MSSAITVEDVEAGPDVECAIRLWGLTKRNGFVCVDMTANEDVTEEDVQAVASRITALADANDGFIIEQDDHLYIFTNDWIERRTTDIEGLLLPAPSKLVDVDGSTMA